MAVSVMLWRKDQVHECDLIMTNTNRFFCMSRTLEMNSMSIR